MTHDFDDIAELDRTYGDVRLTKADTREADPSLPLVRFLARQEARRVFEQARADAEHRQRAA